MIIRSWSLRRKNRNVELGGGGGGGSGGSEGADDADKGGSNAEVNQ